MLPRQMKKLAYTTKRKNKTKNKRQKQRNKHKSNNKQPVSYLCDVRHSILIPRVPYVDHRIHHETSILVVTATTCISYRFLLSY